MEKQFSEIDSRYFKITGLWQFIKGTGDKRFGICQVSAVTGFIFTIHIGIQIINTIYMGYDFSTLTEKLSVNLTCFESAIKILYYCLKRNNLAHLISLFNKDLLICSKHDISVTKVIISRSARYANTVTKMFAYMIFCTVGVWNSLPIISCFYRQDCESWQIMPSWYPFDTRTLPYNIFVYAFEFIIMSYCAALLCTVNCLFSALALSVAAQFKLLSTSFATIEKNADLHVQQYEFIYETAGKKKKKKTQMYKLLRECLMDHQTLLRLTKELEEMYNPIFLFQMLTSTFTICLVLVQLNLHVSSNEELPIAMACKFMMYLMFGSMELLVYSWGGQIIIDKSAAIHWNMYESGWTEGSIKFKKSLIIAMTRSYKPEALTAGKFYYVDLASFTQVMKASYSYFTFIHGSGSVKTATSTSHINN